MRLITADKVKELLHGGWSLDTDADVEYVCSLVDEIPAYDAWIPVEEKLPEEPGYYLTASDAPAGFPKLIRTLMFVKDLHKVDPCNFRGNHRPGWVDWDNEYGYYEYDAVTHWMPLPEPPEGVNDNAES